MTRDEHDDGESTWKHLDVEMRWLIQQLTRNSWSAMISKRKVIGRSCGIAGSLLYFSNKFDWFLVTG
jgi:hypothetical protein